MAKSYITINLEGFDELLKEIEKAGGSINSSIDSCMKKSADIAQDELKNQMSKKKIDQDLINAMPKPEIVWEGNSCTAKVGYKKGKYDPKNLSDGYKAVFLNYGTPRRKPTQERARGFIKAAKKKARPLIKKQQEDTLNEILEGLK